MSTTTTERDEARAALREMLPPGSTVYTILRHVSRSGMLRHIDPVVVVDGGLPQSIAWRVAQLFGEKCAKNGGLKVGGCGMDMGFHLVYELSCALYPDGFTCTGRKRRCPSSDHTNGDRNYRRHRHKSGGYALLQRWL